MLGLAGLLVVLAVVLSAVSLAASIWLVVVAFKRSLVWGLVTLLVPFAAIVFAVRHWQEAKRPFLVGVGTAVASAVLFVGTIGIGTAAMSQRAADLAAQGAAEIPAPAPAGRDVAAPEAGPLPAPGKVEPVSVPPMLFVRNDGPAATALPGAPTGRADLGPFDGADITSDGFAEVPFRDASRAIGRPVRLFTHDGRVHEGDLVAATAASVEIEHGFRSGTVSVEFRKAEVEQLLVRVIP